MKVEEKTLQSVSFFLCFIIALLYLYSGFCSGVHSSNTLDRQDRLGVPNEEAKTMVKEAYFVTHWKQCEQSLLHTALNRTRNEEDAKDLVQATAYRAWRAYSKGKYEAQVCGTFSGWATRILINLSINQYRKDRIRNGLKSQWHSQNLDYIEAEPEPETDVIDDDIAYALARVNPFWRKMILLVAKGYSYQEIAKELGCRVGTVMSGIHRGRAQLYGRLTGQEISYN